MYDLALDPDLDKPAVMEMSGQIRIGLVIP